MELRDTKSFLESIDRSVWHYWSRLVRDGFPNNFALGFIDGMDDLVHGIGIAEEHAITIDRELVRCRALVSAWTPLLYHIPLNTSVRVWLSRLPVDLSEHSKTLEEYGFDSLGVVRHLTQYDADEMTLPMGHGRVLTHCASCIVDILQDPPEATTTTVEDWLSRLNPPLAHYSQSVKLHPLGTNVMDLLSMKWTDVASLVMRRGHQRLLWHYIVACRVKWIDSV